MGAADVLVKALKASRTKIIVFLFGVLSVVLIMGSMMYLVEGEANGFSSIPRSMYWAIVTMTTVGYGDMTPQTNLGQVLAAFVMILGYSIIAIPTGIFSVEIARVSQRLQNTRTCSHCLHEGHAEDAIYCRLCGGQLS